MKTRKKLATRDQRELQITTARLTYIQTFTLLVAQNVAGEYFTLVKRFIVAYKTGDSNRSVLRNCQGASLDQKSRRRDAPGTRRRPGGRQQEVADRKANPPCSVDQQGGFEPERSAKLPRRKP